MNRYRHLSILFSFLLITLLFVQGCCLNGGSRSQQPQSVPEPPPQYSPSPRQTPDPRPAEPEIEYHSYTVMAGDTLAAISAAFYGTINHWRFIADHNGIDDPRTLRVGQVLQIPARAGTSIAATRPTVKRSEQPAAHTGQTAAQQETRPRDKGPVSDSESGTRKRTLEDLFAMQSDAAEPSSPVTDTPPTPTPPPESEPVDEPRSETSIEAKSPKGRIRTTGQAPLLNRPSVLDSNELMTVPAATTLEYFDFSRGFYHVSWQNTSGYIHNRHVTEVTNE
jgi:LysM repeat protein